MAAQKQTAFEFVCAALKRNPKADFASLRDAAKKKRLTLYPIVYGRAKAYLGLVPVKKRKKKAAATKKRGPGRPPKSGAPRNGRRKAAGATTSLDGIVQQIGAMQRDRDRLVKTLGKIRDLINEAI